MAGSPRWVVMGVTASGKSTVGRLLAERLGLRFVDGDDLHPAANIAKMRSGGALTDADRAPWLDAVAGVLADGAEGVVVVCSALRLAYRDRLRRATPGVRFLYLDVPAATAQARAGERVGHWATAGLVETQFAALESPQPHERDVIVVNGDHAPERVVGQALAALGRAGPSRD